MLSEDALANIIQTYNKLIDKNESPGAIIGTMVDPDNGLPTYGGRNRTSIFNKLRLGDVITPHDIPVRCDAIEGNFVLVPIEAVEKIGILSSIYTHGMGDTDYGYRVIESGMSCWVAPGVYGKCSTNSIQGSCRDSDLPLSDRLSKMQRPNELHPTKEWMHYVKLHGGMLWPLLWFKAWIRDKFPFLWAILRSK